MGSRAHVDSKHAPSAKSTHKMLPCSDAALPVHLQGSITPPHGGASPRSDAALPVHLQGGMHTAAWRCVASVATLRCLCICKAA